MLAIVAAPALDADTEGIGCCLLGSEIRSTESAVAAMADRIECCMLAEPLRGERAPSTPATERGTERFEEEGAAGDALSLAGECWAGEADPNRLVFMWRFILKRQT